LIDELTVAENVELPARLRDASRTAAGVLLGRLGLDHLARRFPREISLGEQQRSAIARALVTAPRVLLADEPTAHQDVASARLVFHALRERVAAGGCVAVATHDTRLLEHADRVVEMEDGRLV
jgi:putative ABC transport system ATP-binding protein